MTEPVTRSKIPELEYLARTRRLLEEASRLLEEGGARIAIRQQNLQELPSLWPVEGDLGYITTYFGVSKNPYTGLPYFHKGLDISNTRQGDPVVATADGKVVTAGYDPSYGNMVILQHPNGYYTRYGHMQSLSVRKGQVVEKGARIGKIGNTGLSTGAHVHYEVMIEGQPNDPLEYIDLQRGRL
jgi:murein DD-endopeptidase MepM/ murein hydrolase activator NlpD